MRILPDHEKLEYSGRIDFSDSKAPVMIYPASYVRMRFTGNKIGVYLKNQQFYWDNYVGYIIDGQQAKRLLPIEGETEFELTLPEDGRTEHEILLFKRMDCCHALTFLGFSIAEDGEVLELPPKPQRRIEVYGDSVSAGEVSEAVECTGKPDPNHEGEYSNSWYSYSWMTARKLNAELHDIAQGGIALLPGTGWFCEPDYMGMEQVYDKISYHPALGESKLWDFSLYRPHVVIVAIGQNDSNPMDYMKEEKNGEKAKRWKNHYEYFIRRLRGIYPKAVIILTTTLLVHSAEWDEAIEEVCNRIADDKIYHFMYQRNGVGTPGHIRVGEADEMSEELTAFINSLGEEIWIEE